MWSAGLLVAMLGLLARAPAQATRPSVQGEEGSASGVPAADAPGQGTPSRNAVEGSLRVRLDLPPAPGSGPGCPICGRGIPNAALTHNVHLGADSSALFAGFRFYVRLDDERLRRVQLSFDVGINSTGFMLESKF